MPLRSIIATVALASLTIALLVVSMSGQQSQRPPGAREPSSILPAFRYYLDPPKHIYELEKSYLRWPVTDASRAYAGIRGAPIKSDVEALTAMSRRSRDAGVAYWGRIAGSPQDAEVRQWIEDRFRRIGLEGVRQQTFDLPPQWRPSSWTVALLENGRDERLASAFPFLGTPGTSGSDMELDLAYVGLGRAADFAGRDVRGKAVVIISTPAPGVRDHSAEWLGAIQRAHEKGAAVLLVVLGLPGNIVSLMRGQTKIPSFSIGNDDGSRLVELIERAGAATPRVRVRLQTEMVPNLTTASVWGTLPGASDENVVIIAHHDGYFEAAYDNASGVASMVALAEFYARIPRARRPRTLVFVGTPAHHAGDPGVRWMHDQRATLFAKTALIVCIEHPSATQAYLHGPYLRKSNQVAAKRWAVWGSPALEQILVSSFDMFGVATYADPDTRAGGTLSQIKWDAPSFMTNDAGTFYHTDQDRSDIVPEVGLESATRAFAKTIDDANRLRIEQLKGPAPPEL
jgi:hypothetical protein